MFIDPTSQLRVGTQQQIANGGAATGAEAAEQSGASSTSIALKDTLVKLGLAAADLMQFDINKDGTIDEKEFIKAVNQTQAQKDKSTIPQSNKPLETE